MEKYLYILILCVVVLSAPLAYAQRNAKFKTVDYACLNLSSLVEIKRAEAVEDSKTIQALMQKGCFTTLPRVKVKVLQRYSNAVQVEFKLKDMNMHLVKGLEKYVNIRVWTHLDNI